MYVNNISLWVSLYSRHQISFLAKAVFRCAVDDRQRQQNLWQSNLESQQSRWIKLPFVSLGGNSVPVGEGKESLFTCNLQFALSCLPEASIPLSAVWAYHPARWAVTNSLNKHAQAVTFDTTVCSKLPHAASGNWFLYIWCIPLCLSTNIQPHSATLYTLCL